MYLYVWVSQQNKHIHKQIIKHKQYIIHMWRPLTGCFWGHGSQAWFVVWFRPVEHPKRKTVAEYWHSKKPCHLNQQFWDFGYPLWSAHLQILVLQSPHLRAPWPLHGTSHRAAQVKSNQLSPASCKAKSEMRASEPWRHPLVQHSLLQPMEATGTTPSTQWLLESQGLWWCWIILIKGRIKMIELCFIVLLELIVMLRNNDTCRLRRG